MKYKHNCFVKLRKLLVGCEMLAVLCLCVPFKVSVFKSLSEFTDKRVKKECFETITRAVN